MKKHTNGFVHHSGFDSLRVILSFLVVIAHATFLVRSPMHSIKDFESHQYQFVDFAYFNIVYLAVPMFFLISLFLFFSKKVDKLGLFKQIKFLSLVTLFWASLFTIWSSGYLGIVYLKPNSLLDFLETILRAGNTVYYFFVILIILKTVAFYVQGIGVRGQIFGFILSVTLLSILPKISIDYNLLRLTAYWNPLNFIPYVFAAALVAKNYKFLRTNVIAYIVLTLLTIFFFIIEWNYYRSDIYFTYESMGIPAYARTSLVYSSILILLLFLNITRSSHVKIKFLSNHSFGIYVLHLFILHLISGILDDYVSYGSPLFSLLVISITIGCCLVMSVFLKRYVLSEWVFR